MTFIQGLYTFDPIRFQTLFEETILNENQIDEARLLDIANNVISNTTEVVWEVLDYLRFDEEYMRLPDPSEDISYTIFWYLILLASTVEKIPNISKLGILSMVLPIAGWTGRNVEEILRGDRLGSIGILFDNPVYFRELKAADQYGGWLSVEKIQSLLSEIINSKVFLSPPTKELVIQFLRIRTLNMFRHSTDYNLLVNDINEIDARITDEAVLEAEKDIEFAYNETKVMLQAASDSKKPLLLFLD